jgi:hypothetical protein
MVKSEPDYKFKIRFLHSKITLIHIELSKTSVKKTLLLVISLLQNLKSFQPPKEGVEV